MASEFAARLPADRAESGLADLKPALNEGQARAEASRCLYCFDAPCIGACPTGIDIPEFIRKIASGNYRGSARTILSANILGLSCAAVCPVEVLCAGDCVFNDKGEPPIQIGLLQRFSTEWAYDRGLRFFEKGAPTGHRVALIGAGPASLAAAHELTVLGHECVLFEGRALPGGLNTTGVAPYKMRAEMSIREVEYIKEIGFEIRTGVEVVPDGTAGTLGAASTIAFSELEREFDAIFIGVGLGPDSRQGLPGEDLAGVWGACALIERIKNSGRDEVGYDAARVKNAVVIGGGNTAIDVVRELRKLDVENVTMVYRRGEHEMPGYDHEVAYARREGVQFHLRANPTAYVPDAEDASRVGAVRLVRMELGEPDESGRRRPKPVDGSEHELPAQLVAIATGQEKLETLLGSIAGLELHWGRVKVDAASGRTGNPRYWSGGDCANGGKEVVNAAAEGKLAARSIDGAMRDGSVRRSGA